MDKLQIFNNTSFGQIRTVEIGGVIHFVASDIAKALGYTNPSKAINDHCRWVTKRYIGVQTGIKADGTPAMQDIAMNVIPKGDIYRLVANSELPGAEKFESWIFDEVIPSIDKHGAYLTPEKIEEVLLNPDTVIQLATALKEEREKNRALLPKAESFDTFMDAKNNQTMNVVAKSLGVGRNKLFDLLRQHKVFMANNTPFQTYIERGYFEVKEKPITMGDNTFNKPQTFVTAKGVVFLEKFLKEKVVLV